ncbi:unnamed protein product [Protopolystoma xenopodis]|uniref:Dolichyl-diphosphooligosaccharide--protein glycosyltransferase subunit STT3A n=1 Tax=Protopolystoma xenopodis TaxID=117903 RepID=A0A3S5A5P8_9PLAT|nr:unnamed protein product [Protopolystoma xenopodis]
MRPCFLGKIFFFLTGYSLTTIATYLLTSEVNNVESGLIAACMVSIVPGYISRSVAGSYDNEGIAIFCMILTFYCWIKSIKTGSIFWGVLCSLAYFYMVSSWGGYVFLINIIPIHVLVLILTGRFNHRIYSAYSTLYCLGTIFSMQISFVGFLPVISSEHMGALGVFGLCQLYAFFEYLYTKLNKEQFGILIRFVLTTVGILFGASALILTFSGKIVPWTGRFYSLLDPSYAKNHIPIIASVSEHQPTAWGKCIIEITHVLVGMYYCLKKLTDANIFIIVYGVFSLYFSVS